MVISDTIITHFYSDTQRVTIELTILWQAVKSVMGMSKTYHQIIFIEMHFLFF